MANPNPNPNPEPNPEPNPNPNQALPPKYETALTCRLTPVQRQLYSAFLTHVRGEEGVTDGGAPSVRRLIGGYQTMQQIFNHPSTLYRNLASQGPGNKPTRQSGYDSMDDFMVTEDDTSGDSDAGNGGGGGGGGRGGVEGGRAAAEQLVAVADKGHALQLVMEQLAASYGISVEELV